MSFFFFRWYPKLLVTLIPNIGIIIDITNTTKYYNPKVRIPKQIEHLHACVASTINCRIFHTGFSRDGRGSQENIRGGPSHTIQRELLCVSKAKNYVFGVGTLTICHVFNRFRGAVKKFLQDNKSNGNFRFRIELNVIHLGSLLTRITHCRQIDWCSLYAWIESDWISGVSIHDRRDENDCR